MDPLDRRHQRMVGGAKPVRIPSKKNRASKGGRKLISACDAADTENEFPQVVPCTSPDQKHSNDNVDDHPRNSIFSPAYHHQKECAVRLLVTLAKGLEHKGDTLGSASPIEEDKTHDHGRKEATTVRSGSNQGICLIYLWWFPSFSLFSFQSKLGAALQLPLYLIWMKHSCIQLLDPVRMLISHFQFILTSESTQYMFDAVPISKSSWRGLPECSRQLFSLVVSIYAEQLPNVIDPKTKVVPSSCLPRVLCLRGGQLLQ